jgi:hypothetical protein
LLILVTQQWGFASGVAYFLIVYEIWIGEAAKLPRKHTCCTNKKCWFVLVDGQSNGYMLGTDGWYTGLVGKGSVDAVYNIADAINKLGLISNLYLL